MGLLSSDSGIADLVGGVVSSVGSLLGMGLTVSFFLIFIIFEANFLPGRIERAWPGGVSGSCSRYANSDSREHQYVCCCQNGRWLGYCRNYSNHPLHLRNRFVVYVGFAHLHSQLCTLHWFIDCNDSTADSRIRNLSPVGWFIM